jgi:hypothetical protein
MEINKKPLLAMGGMEEVVQLWPRLGRRQEE